MLNYVITTLENNCMHYVNYVNFLLNQKVADTNMSDYQTLIDASIYLITYPPLLLLSQSILFNY